MTTVSLCSQLLKEHFHPHLIFPELASEIGFEESIVLQQIHYWIQKSGKSIEGSLWIYNTFEDWREQFIYWSLSKIKRIFYSLERYGLIKSKKMNVKKSNHTKWYSINYDKFNTIITNLTFATDKPQKGYIDKKFDGASKLEQKKFASFKSELSSSQFETIINSNTNNNLQNNFLSLRERGSALPKKEVKLPLAEKRKKTFSESEKIIGQNMIEVWKSVMIKEKRKITVTPRRIEKLLDAWNTQFNQDFEQWRSFCLAVNSSKFLMGEKKQGFKAYFDWIIEGQTISQILVGEFGIGDRVPDIQQEALEKERQSKLREHQAKQEEEAKQKLKEEKKQQIERLADRLMYEELDKLEASWTEEEAEEAKLQFKSYVLEGVSDDENLRVCQKLSEQWGWNSPFTDFYFRDFKLKYFLNKTFDCFRERASRGIS